jgi:hypothetical protein
MNLYLHVIVYAIQMKLEDTVTPQEIVPGPSS